MSVLRMSKIVRGGLYKHYANRKLYKVLGVAKHHKNLGSWVVYKGLYNHESLGNNPIFTRELDDFCATVNGKERFKRVYKSLAK